MIAANELHMPMVVLILFGGIFLSCSTTKHLSEDRYLHNATKINLVDKENVTNPKSVHRSLREVSFPKLNNKMRLRFHNFTGVPLEKKSPWRWLGKKIGQAPVLYDAQKTSTTRNNLWVTMKNLGYLDATVHMDTLQTGQKINVTYTVRASSRYSIGKVRFPKDTLGLSLYRMGIASMSHLRKGDPFLRRTIDQERTRIAAALQDSAFFDAATHQVFFLADTNQVTRTVDIYVMINKPTDRDNYQKYKVGNTFIDANYSLRPRPVDRDTAMIRRGVFAINSDNIINQRMLGRLVRQQEGAFYSPKQQELSTRHLAGLGIFKFTQVVIDRDTSDGQSIINRYYRLTPGAMQRVTGSLELNTRTGNFLGSSASAFYNHDNLFLGAEKLHVGFTGGLATQLNEGERFINTSNLDLTFSLRIPRFLGPRRLTPLDIRGMPYTSMALGIGYEERVGFYGFHTGKLQLGYEWQSNNNFRHELYPISIQVFDLVNTSDNFEDIRRQNRRLDQSFNDVLIGGLTYHMSWTRPSTRGRNNAIFANLEVESSGNMLNLVSGLIQKNNADDLNTWFDLPISQFIKLNLDFRHFHYIGNQTLILRVNTGMGFAYGNSEFMPYSRQFTMGGANGLRAFQLRALGPGSFLPTLDPGVSTEDQFLDQTGNLKLEMNAEYRFPLIRYLKGAVFIDAGNIWLTGTDAIPEGTFKPGGFYKEIAMGTGLGLRLDFTYFVIRLDGAFALRKPAGPGAFRWTLRDIDLFDKGWRKENIVWHLALGYPF